MWDTFRNLAHAADIASAHSGGIPDLALSSEIVRLFSASMSVNTSKAYRVGI